MSLENAFRELRLKWFNRVLRSYSQERVWEDEEEYDLRIKHNELLLEKYNEQTERIINGEKLDVAPYHSYEV